MPIPQSPTPFLSSFSTSVNEYETITRTPEGFAEAFQTIDQNFTSLHAFFSLSCINTTIRHLEDELFRQRLLASEQLDYLIQTEKDGRLRNFIRSKRNRSPSPLSPYHYSTSSPIEPSTTPTLINDEDIVLCTWCNNGRHRTTDCPQYEC